MVLRAGGRDWKASAEGTGAVDALYRAVDAALAEILGGNPLLLAYDVHALAEGPDAEGRVTVRIAPPPSSVGDRSAGRFTGEVASGNTIAASVEAYIEALNAMLGAARGPGPPRLPPRRWPGRQAETAAAAEFEDGAEPIDATEWFNR